MKIIFSVILEKVDKTHCILQASNNLRFPSEKTETEILKKRITPSFLIDDHMVTECEKWRAIRASVGGVLARVAC